MSGEIMITIGVILVFAGTGIFLVTQILLHQWKETFLGQGDLRN